MPGNRSGFSYSVSILRKASGRGKSRKVGGLVSLELPDQDEASQSPEVLFNLTWCMFSYYSPLVHLALLYMLNGTLAGHLVSVSQFILDTVYNLSYHLN